MLRWRKSIQSVPRRIFVACWSNATLTVALDDWILRKIERKKYLMQILWRLLMFRDYWNWTYFASACDALLFSEWWKHWMPLVTIFMDIVRDLTASMHHNIFWWFDCAPFWTLIAHQFRIMRFFVTGYLFDLNEQINWISFENGLQFCIEGWKFATL